MRTGEPDIRCRRCVVDTNTLYYYNDRWQVLCEYDGGGVCRRFFIYGNYIDEVLFIYNFEPTPYYGWYLYDHLYSPVALVDYYGNINERYEYDVYGNPHILEPNFAPDPDGKSDYDNPYLFTGRRVDFLDNGNLTLQINRYRYYDYYTGRWLTQDFRGLVLGTSIPVFFLEYILRAKFGCDYFWNYHNSERCAILLTRSASIPFYYGFDPLEQYQEGDNLYEYGLSNPARSRDPMGFACKVYYKCALTGSSTFKLCFKHCEYQCIEDKTKKRVQYGPFGVPCDDPRIPGMITHAYSTFICKKCKYKQSIVKYYADLEFDWKDCSRKACRANARKQGKKMRKMCNLLKGKKKIACKALAHAIEAGMEALCDLCKKR